MSDSQAPDMILPASLDIQQAAPLQARLLALRGQAVTLDGSAVERLGGLCLQVLLSAQCTWIGDGQALRISPVSEALARQWTAFGAPALDQGEPA